MIDYLKIYTLLDEILADLFNSEDYEKFLESYKNYTNNYEVKIIIDKVNAEFSSLKYIENNYGLHSKEYVEQYKNYFLEKKNLDLNNHIVEYKLKEQALQKIVDSLAKNIVQDISEDIILDNDTVFDNKKCASCKCNN